VLPENFAIMAQQDADRLAAAERDGQGPIQEFLATQARKHAVWLVGGTIPIKANDPKRVRAAACCSTTAASASRRYDKITCSMCVSTTANCTTSRPLSSRATPRWRGHAVGKLGLAVCYDLRFPELFRRLLDQGAELFAVPSAFTVRTGRAHWEVLCARAPWRTWLT